MHSWRWFDQWISSSERGVESYLFFYEIAGRSRSEPVGKIEDAPILNPRWEMQGGVVASLRSSLPCLRFSSDVTAKRLRHHAQPPQ